MDDVTSQYHFSACMDSAKTLCNLLKSIQFRECAVVDVLKEGLKLTVEEGKSVQASAYIPSDNFTEYHVPDNIDVSFKIKLSVLTQCLNIFGPREKTRLDMRYRCEGSPLLLILQPKSKSNVTTDCEISTMMYELTLDLSDEKGPEVAMLVLEAKAFRELLTDLEPYCDAIEIKLSPEHPNVSIITKGMLNRCCIDIPKSSDLVESFTCKHATTVKYQMRHFRHIMKGLAISSYVRLQVSSNGVLLTQLLLDKVGNSQRMHSEFIILPLL